MTFLPVKKLKVSYVKKQNSPCMCIPKIFPNHFGCFPTNINCNLETSPFFNTSGCTGILAAKITLDRVQSPKRWIRVGHQNHPKPSAGILKIYA